MTKVNNVITVETVIKLTPNIHCILISFPYAFSSFTNAKAISYVRNLFCTLLEARTRMNGVKFLPFGMFQTKFVFPST